MGCPLPKTMSGGGKAIIGSVHMGRTPLSDYELHCSPDHLRAHDCMIIIYTKLSFVPVNLCVLLLLPSNVYIHKFYFMLIHAAQS